MMETASSLVLPVGCHFEPSDKELLLHFLYKKVHGLPLSCNAVMECDLYGDEETWRQLFDQNSKRCLYFFTVLKKKTEKGSRVERTSSGCVTWRSQTDKAVKVKLEPHAATETHIGFERVFSYIPKEGSTSKAKGDWIMHGFRLDERFLNKNNKANCVLCRVTNKQKLQPRSLRRLIRANVNHEMKSNIVSELYREEQNYEEEVDVGREILKLLD